MLRRSFLTGLASLFVAPAIVRPEVLMPINSSLVPTQLQTWIGSRLIEFRRFANPDDPTQYADVAVTVAIRDVAGDMIWRAHDGEGYIDVPQDKVVRYVRMLSNGMPTWL